MASFGGPTIDAIGVVDDAPAQSMMTGLLANALGWSRDDAARQSELQDRLAVATLWPQEAASRRIVDYQTALIDHNDVAWTTRPAPRDVENRKASGKTTFAGSHQRWRHYHADLRVLVALSLEPPDQTPTLDDLAAALRHPARVLFIGRKPCIPSSPIYQGELQAETPQAALAAMGDGRGFWPASSDDDEMNVSHVFDLRDFNSGLHGGSRLRSTGTVKSFRGD